MALVRGLFDRVLLIAGFLVGGFDPASMMVAATLGVACWLLFLALWHGISLLADLMVARFFRPGRY
jgi:hypothetical protein